MLSFISIPIIVDGSGDNDVTSSGHVPGRIVAVTVDLGTLAGTSDFTLYTSGPGYPETQFAALSNVTADTVSYPRSVVVDTANSAITDGHVATIMADSIRIVTAQGGASKTGHVFVWVER